MSSLGELISAAQRIVFFGGAGVSTESGIPDFRSATGLYSTKTGEYPPEYMLSHSCFVDHPQDFFDFYRTHMLYPTAQPNDAHRALATLEKQGKLHAVITQNIDGLHQAAGSQNVIELHGSVHRNYCINCRASYPMDFILHSQSVPMCKKCGAIVKPDVVLYEEPLSEHAMTGAVTAISEADTLIIGGTSLNVYPAAGLIHYFHGQNIIVINKGETGTHVRATLTIREPIGETLSEFLPASNTHADTPKQKDVSAPHSLIIALNVQEDQVGGGLGRAHTMAIAAMDNTRITSWDEYEVNWDVLHDQGEHGAHHARIVRFLREHGVHAVVTGHAGPPMRHTLEKMHITPVFISGSVKEAAQAASDLLNHPAQTTRGISHPRKGQIFYK